MKKILTKVKKHFKKILKINFEKKIGKFQKINVQNRKNMKINEKIEIKNYETIRTKI